MNRRTWKKGEQTVAEYFNTERTPLSGGNSKITRSDTLHKKLFIECKHLLRIGLWTLYEKVKILARKENKIPVITLKQKGKNGFLIVVHSDYLKEFIREIIEE